MEKNDQNQERHVCRDVWRAMGFGGAMLPIHSNLDKREPGQKYLKLSHLLLVTPFGQNPRKPVDTDGAG